MNTNLKTATQRLSNFVGGYETARDIAWSKFEERTRLGRRTAQDAL